MHTTDHPHASERRPNHAIARSKERVTTKPATRLLANIREARAALRTDGLTALPTHHPPDAKRIRLALGLTQQTFADRFTLPVGSVRDWKQGRVLPDRAAQALLRVIEHAPDTVAEALASAPAPRPPSRRRRETA